jgi:hypothetical protein
MFRLNIRVGYYQALDERGRKQYTLFLTFVILLCTALVHLCYDGGLLKYFKSIF